MRTLSIVKLVSTLVITAELLAMLPVHSAYADHLTYSDIEYSWYQPVIESLSSDGSITGYDDGTFRPRDVINRAEFLTLLMRSQSTSEPVVGGRRCFSDVNPDVWYAKWVCAAERRGIVEGYPNGTFRGEQPVNIAEAHAMVLRLLDAQVENVSGENWYKPYSEYLHDQEIVSKYSYVAWDPLLRERAADLIYKLNTYKDHNRSSKLSAGCGRPQPSGTMTTIDVHGEQRELLLTVPSSYQNRTPTPLLFAFHGRTNSAEQVKQYYGFDREMNDYIIVYPQALQDGSGGQTYRAPGDSAQEMRDIAFFDELVHTVSDLYCVDMFRIYTAGHSLGGWFANTIGCVRGDIVRATGSVGSSTTVTNCRAPAAGIFIHNPEDNLASISSGKVARDQRLEENYCDNVPQGSSPTSLNCEEYSCAEGQSVKWCPHNESTDHRGVYYPHVWPKDAERAIHNFFEALPK